jgi:hypothetical protein
MSPTSVCYTVTKDESGDLGATRDSLGAGKHKAGGSSFQFGIRKQEKMSETSPPLKVSRESHRIRKQPLPLPQVQYRPPIIIHTYSPKVIHTQPDDFMSLVQKLTGSSDTRLRLKRKPAKKASAPAPDQNDLVDAVADLEQQGSKLAQCASPSSSDEDSSFLASEPCGGDLAMKQSHSPRSPLSNFEFDSPDLMFTPFDASSSNILFSHVKAEPSFSFNDNSFNFFSESFISQLPKGLMKQEALPKQVLHQEYSPFHSSIDINSPIPTPGFLPPSSIAGLPDLSPASANWSQSFLDSHTGAPSHFTNQNAILRQRFSGGYAPSSEGTMVALENIQAFMLS